MLCKETVGRGKKREIVQLSLAKVSSCLFSLHKRCGMTKTGYCARQYLDWMHYYAFVCVNKITYKAKARVRIG